MAAPSHQYALVGHAPETEEQRQAAHTELNLHRGYIVLSVIRWIALLTVVYITIRPRQATIEAVYTGVTSLCDTCLAQARQQPNTLFEFGTCSAQPAYANVAEANLMKKAAWFSTPSLVPSSTVDMMSTLAAVHYSMPVAMSVLIAALGIWLFGMLDSDAHTANAHKSVQFGLIAFEFLINLLSSFMMLLMITYGYYISPGAETPCYIFSYPVALFGIVQIVLWIFAVVAIVLQFWQQPVVWLLALTALLLMHVSYLITALYAAKAANLTWLIVASAVSFAFGCALVNVCVLYSPDSS